jgi:hypothetical protein
MPKDACQFFYECKGCGIKLNPLPGTAAYSDLMDRFRSPSIQRDLRRGTSALDFAILRTIATTLERTGHWIKMRRSLPVQRSGRIKLHPILGGLHQHYVPHWVFGTHDRRLAST